MIIPIMHVTSTRIIKAKRKLIFTKRDKEVDKHFRKTDNTDVSSIHSCEERKVENEMFNKHVKINKKRREIKLKMAALPSQRRCELLLQKLF